MRELYFVSPYRRSIRTLHFQYGYAGKKNIAGKITGKYGRRFR